MNESTFTVQGMTCGGCATKVTTAVQAVSGVTDVKVDITDGTLTVAGGEEAAVTAAVEGAGYAVSRA